MAFEPAGLVLLDVMPAKRPLAVIFEPVEGVVGRVATGEVEIAVAVEVGRRDAEGVAVLVGNEVLGEARRFLTVTAHEREKGERDKNDARANGAEISHNT